MTFWIRKTEIVFCGKTNNLCFTYNFEKCIIIIVYWFCMCDWIHDSAFIIALSFSHACKLLCSCLILLTVLFSLNSACAVRFAEERFVILHNKVDSPWPTPPYFHFKHFMGVYYSHTFHLLSYNNNTINNRLVHVTFQAVSCSVTCFIIVV